MLDLFSEKQIFYPAPSMEVLWQMYYVIMYSRMVGGMT